MSKVITMIMAFIFVAIISFFMIGFIDSAPVPAANTTAAAQYNNLSQATEIGGNGLLAVFYIMIGAMVITAIMLLISASKKVQ